MTQVLTPDGKPVEFPDDMSMDQIKTVMRQKFGGPQPKPNTAADMAQSFGGGLVKAGADIAGTPGNAKAAMDTVLPAMVGTPLSLITHAMTPNLPTSEQLVNAVTAPFGGAYQPKTEFGRVSEKVGRFAPMAAAGPVGPIATPARVLAPVAGSEAGRALTRGTALEPYGEGVGAVVGSLGQSMGEARAANTKAAAAVPTEQQFADKANQMYEDFGTKPVTLTPEAERTLSDQMGKAAIRKAIQGAVAHEDDQLKAELETLLQRQPSGVAQATGAPANIPLAPQEVAEKAALGGRGYADLSPAERAALHESTQPGLAASDAGSIPDQPFTTSAKAVDKVSKAFRTMATNATKTDREIGAGLYGKRANIEGALEQVPEVGPARATFSQVRKSEAINEAVQDAANRRQTAGGMDQALRVELGQLLHSPEVKNWKPAEIDALRTAVNGDASGNVLTQIGKFSAHHALTGLLGGGAGYAAGGPLGMAGALGAAEVGRSMGARETARNIAQLLGTVRNMGEALPKSPAVYNNAMMANLLSQPIQSGARQ